MSLNRQIWLLLLCTVLLAFAGSVVIHVGSGRATLQTQLRLNNSDSATAIAQVLSQKKGDLTLMELALAAQFDIGTYRLIRLVGADGKVVLQRSSEIAPLEAPGWFVHWVPIDSVVAVAQVSDGWRALGSVEVAGQSAYAHDELWRGSLRSALALGLLGLAAGALAALGVRRICRPLDEVVQQAASLERGEYLTVPDSKVPELRRLTRAMNSMVERLRTVFEAQATQVETMRRQASCDPLTGLANRGRFMAQLVAVLQREDGMAAGGLILLRVLSLGDVNHTLGRESTDRLISTIGHTLQTYMERVDGSFVGRLNGSDFALFLPEGGLAQETAQTLVVLLRTAFSTSAAPVAVAAGAAELRHGSSLAELMSRADLALARAESAGPFAIEFIDEDTGEAANSWAALGERGWRERLLAALAEGRAQLGAFPLVDGQNRVIHLECPLRLQLEPNGRFEVAAHWLPLARRSRLNSAIDERALALALEAIARDGQPRCVNIATASLADRGFAARVRSQLRAMPREARHVWLEITEAAAADQFDLMQELSRQVRPTGARFGLEHAGERLRSIDHLFEAGLDYVKLDVAVTHGVATDQLRTDFVKGLITMLHGLSLQVYGEGVTDEADAQTLWSCGVDGLTGPWISSEMGDLAVA